MTIAQAVIPTPFDISQVNPAPKITNISIAGLLTGGGFNILNFIFFLVGVFFLTSLLMASVAYISSSGDPKRISDATNRLTNSLLGLVIVFASFIIVRLAASILGYGSILPF